MAEKEIIRKRQSTSFTVRVLLLLLLIFLPFGMYFALVNEQSLILTITAAALLISMLVLVSLR
jgi:glycopeptide antibiotics resistance protein